MHWGFSTHASRAGDVLHTDFSVIALGKDHRVAGSCITPPATTPSYQLFHSPKVKTCRSHRQSTARFRSTRNSFNFCFRHHTSSHRSNRS